MALQRFVLTADVPVTADTLATVAAGEPGTGGAAGSGNAATSPSGTQGQYGLFPVPAPAGLWQRGMVVYADDSGPGVPPTGPQLLYAAIGAANLRPYVQGQDDAGHAAISN